MPEGSGLKTSGSDGIGDRSPVQEPSATASDVSGSPGSDANRSDAKRSGAQRERVSPPRGSAALPREKRLAKRREFLRVYETGRKIFSRYTVVFFAANDLPHSRIGITATKKSGKANVRNRLKRRTREVYRRQREAIGIDAKSIDVVVNVKPNAAQASYLEYSQDLTRVLRRVVSECTR